MDGTRTGSDGPTDAAQDFACIAVLSADWRLVALCEAAEDMLGCTPREAIGRPVEAVFPAQTAHRMRSRSQALTPQDPIIYIAGCPVPNHPDGLDVTAALTEGHYVFAFEAPDPTVEPSFEIEHVQRLLTRIGRHASVEDAARATVRSLRAFLVVDRVSLHLVEAGQIGPTLAFSGASPLDSAPADHLLSEVDLTHISAPMVVPLLPALERDLIGNGTPAPLSMMPNRALPDRLSAALRADGVLSVQVYPVYREDQLWAVFLCHHSHPMRPHFSDRRMMAVFTGLLGHVFTAKLAGQGPAQPAIKAPESITVPSSGPLDGLTVMVLDDDILTNVDASNLIVGLGAAHVVSCTTVEKALAYLRETKLDLALLDVRLGGETSVRVARKCQAEGIPAVLVTGYAVSAEQVSDFPDMPLIKKPFTPKMLGEQLAAAVQVTS